MNVAVLVRYEQDFGGDTVVGIFANEDLAAAFRDKEIRERAVKFADSPHMQYKMEDYHHWLTEVQDEPQD